MNTEKFIAKKKKEISNKRRRTKFEIERSTPNKTKYHLLMLKNMSSFFITEEVEEGAGDDYLSKVFGGSSFDILNIRTFSDFDIELEIRNADNITINYIDHDGNSGKIKAPYIDSACADYICVALEEECEGGLQRLAKSYFENTESPEEQITVIQRIFMGDGEIPELRKIPLTITKEFIPFYGICFDDRGMTAEQAEKEMKRRIAELKELVEEK